MVSLGLVALVSVSAVAQSDSLPVTTAGQSACVLVVAAREAHHPQIQQAASVIAGTVQAWASATLEVVPVEAGAWGEQPTVVLATLDALRALDPALEQQHPALREAAFLDPHGFAIVPTERRGIPLVLIAGRTPRGVYNGAVHAREFLLDGPADHLRLAADPVVRSPRMRGRAVYTLTIWGNEAEYTAADWEIIFDSFAREGYDRIYFWVSGHFPSRQYPQTYKCRDGNWDTTEKTRIGTIEDLQRIIRAAHDRGMTLYLGSALGAWVGTMHLTNQAPGTMKTGSGIAPGSLCPSQPESRKALIAYHKEMFDALPEADGLYIESADEWGGCECAMCAAPVDGQGSKQFGQAQLTLLQEIMGTVWTDHPHARCAYTIGYAEHTSDPAYYERVRRMGDPRMEWMEARDSWEFPDRDGTAAPACAFTSQAMRWRQYYNLPLEDLAADANRASRAGWYGLITAFEPGAGTGSFYRDIPYPTDELPYTLTGFVFREVTWDPARSVADLREQVRRGFFGAEADAILARDLWDLREMILTAAQGKVLPEAALKNLGEMEARLRQARATASPKTAETLDRMERGIRHVREHARMPE